MINKYRLVYTLLLLAFWPVVTQGFICDELLPFLSPVKPLVMGASDIIVTIMGFILLRDKTDRIVFWSFIVLAAATTLVNHISLGTTLNGMRDFIGLTLTVPIWRYLFRSPYRREFIEKFDRQLFIYLIIQAVCLTEQFLRYGANDHGGGSWGNNQSGIVSTSIYYVSFYLMTRRWDTDLNYVQNLWKNVWLIVLLYPTFLNETKVSFVYLLLYFPLLYKINRNYIFKLLKISPIAIGLVVLLVPVYLSVTHQDMEKIFTQESMIEYISGGDNLDEYIDIAQKAQDNPNLIIENLWAVDVPRFAKIGFAPSILHDQSGGIILGAGLGHFKGGTMVSTSKFATKNEWVLTGTRPWLYFILIQLGILGIIWFVVSMFLEADFRRNYMDPFGTNIKLYFTLFMLILMFYNEAPRAMPLCLLFFYALAQTTTPDKTLNSERATEDKSKLTNLNT